MNISCPYDIYADRPYYCPQTQGEEMPPEAVSAVATDNQAATQPSVSGPSEVTVAQQGPGGGSSVADSLLLPTIAGLAAGVLVGAVAMVVRSARYFIRSAEDRKAEQRERHRDLAFRNA